GVIVLPSEFLTGNGAVDPVKWRSVVETLDLYERGFREVTERAVDLQQRAGDLRAVAHVHRTLKRRHSRAGVAELQLAIGACTKSGYAHVADDYGAVALRFSRGNRC